MGSKASEHKPFCGALYKTGTIDGTLAHTEPRETGTTTNASKDLGNDLRACLRVIHDASPQSLSTTDGIRANKAVVIKQLTVSFLLPNLLANGRIKSINKSNTVRRVETRILEALWGNLQMVQHLLTIIRQLNKRLVHIEPRLLDASEGVTDKVWAVDSGSQGETSHSLLTIFNGKLRVKNIVGGLVSHPINLTDHKGGSRWATIFKKSEIVEATPGVGQIRMGRGILDCPVEGFLTSLVDTVVGFAQLVPKVAQSFLVAFSRLRNHRGVLTILQCPDGKELLLAANETRKR